MKKSTKAFLFQLPFWIVVVGAFLTAVYIKISGIYPLSWITVILLLVIIISYFYGRGLENTTKISIKD